MDNVFAEKLKQFIVERLNGAGGYAGVADAQKKAFINGEDRFGNTIKVVIEAEEAT